MSRAGRPSERLLEADRHAREVMQRALDSVNAWMAQNVAEGGVCDFCAHRLEAGRFTTWTTHSPITAGVSGIMDDLGAATLPFVYDPFWAACYRCDPVVEQGDAEALADHALATRDAERVAIRDSAATRDDLVSLYDEFFARKPERVG